MTKREAEQLLTARLHQLDMGVWAGKDHITVGAFRDLWLESVRSEVKQSTWLHYRDKTMHLAPLFGLRLRDLEAGHLLALRNQLDLSPRSLHHVHVVAGTMLNTAKEWGYLAAVPQVKPPRVPKTPPRVWTTEQTVRFLDATRSDSLYALWRVAFTTGARRGELLGMKWGDIDGDQWRISRTVVNTPNGAVIQEGETKTSKGRIVTLDAATVDALTRHRSNTPIASLEGWVWVKTDGTRYSPHQITSRFRQAVQAAGLPALTLHGARHTHATIGLTQGVHPKVMQQRLGHATVSVTLDTYSHVLGSQDRDAAEQVSRALTTGGASADQ